MNEWINNKDTVQPVSAVPLPPPCPLYLLPLSKHMHTLQTSLSGEARRERKSTSGVFSAGCVVVRMQPIGSKCQGYSGRGVFSFLFCFILQPCSGGGGGSRVFRGCKGFQ